MALHRLGFVGIQASRLEQDVVADPDFANVMKEGAGDQVAHPRAFEADLLGQAHGIGGDAKMVQAGHRVALGNGRADDLHELDVAGQQIARLANHVAVERQDDRIEAERGQRHRGKRHQQGHDQVLAQAPGKLRIDQEGAFEIAGRRAIRCAEGHEDAQSAQAIGVELAKMTVLIQRQFHRQARHFHGQLGIPRIHCRGQFAPHVVLKLSGDETVPRQLGGQLIQCRQGGLRMAESIQVGGGEHSELGRRHRHQLAVDPAQAHPGHRDADQQ